MPGGLVINGRKPNRDSLSGHKYQSGLFGADMYRPLLFSVDIQAVVAV